MAKRKVEELPRTILNNAGLETKSKKAKSSPAPHTPKTNPGRIVVDKINSLEPQNLISQYLKEPLLTPNLKTQPFTISLVPSDALTAGEHNATFALVERTSKHDYQTSGDGWHPSTKRKEMLEADMRYLLVRRKANSIATNPKPPQSQSDEGLVLDESILGYASFMFTTDSVPEVPVIYLYEIHLAEDVRGLGLGAWLMHVVETLAERIEGVEKVMLTCFLSNERAYGFYRSRGYEKDVSSPAERKIRGRAVKRVQYEIMSKEVGDGWEEVEEDEHG